MDMVKRGDMLSKDDVLDILAIDLIGVVPDDENIVVLQTRGNLLWAATVWQEKLI